MGRDSGGVAVYMKNNLAADMVTVASYSNGVIEFFGLYSKANNLLLLVMYRQPDDITGGNRSTQTEFKQALGELENVLLSTQNPTPDILLCGDFNLPNANWTEGRAGPGAKKDEKTMIEDLITITNGYFLSQFIQKPTHKNGNTLDLLFTNNPRILHSHNAIDTVSVFSDHYIVECFTMYNTTPSEKDQHPENSSDAETGLGNFNFFGEETDWWKIENDLAQHNWEFEFRGTNP